MTAPVALYVGEELGRYGFPDGHPFGPDRQDAFWSETVAQALDRRAMLRQPRSATREELLSFHTEEHVDYVSQLSDAGYGTIDYGDTPAYPGVFEASSAVVGSALDGLAAVMNGTCLRAFQPIGGLHHARRDRAAGFCVFNETGVLIEALRKQYGIKRIAYVDIDVHHGDGVYYSYDNDPDVIIADVHEDGRYLYPGTGRAEESGSGQAKGTKLNVPLAPGAGDEEFMQEWERVTAHLQQFKPEFFLVQCGADSLKGDPLAHLTYSPAAHAHAAGSLCRLANDYAQGRIMAFGGGGYNRRNLALAWNAVLKELIEAKD
jgi:acetoin utilization protein AcuC